MVNSTELVKAIPFVVSAGAIIYLVVSAFRKEKAGRCNIDVDLTCPKVKHIFDMEDLGANQAYCRCWKSKKFPRCDGSHEKHNKETGDNVGPLIITNKSMA